ncbi:MAG TPA: PQQ-binding-like beta-propeller repeat protein [Bryobacteraceae bacterium]|nr:PQQ-binding-like beta-propeller repeat protein [Bryobacteraceae bacterium]
MPPHKTKRFLNLVPFLSGSAAFVFLLVVPAKTQQGAVDGNWTSYGGDAGNTRYSPLSQIDAGNFSKLEVAWTFSTANLGPAPETNLEATPLVIDGVLYSTAGDRRDVIALNAANGELLWIHREDEGKRAEVSPRRLSGRGLAYWADGSDKRIVYFTTGYRMVELDAKTGNRIPSFGVDGVVDLKQDDDQEIDPMSSEIGIHATPMIGRNTIVVGAAHKPGGVPTSKTNVKGYVRGYDVRTGKRKWIFHTVPKPGEVGFDTWLADSWSYTGNTGAWGQSSIDEARGVVYIGVEEPTGDFYGGPRPGNNLFGESLVALDLETGQRLWHFQYVHHGIWDHDNPSPPILADVQIKGRRVPVVAQPSKQAFLYVFNRETGEPVWPIEERPVEKGDVPGEWYSPTQPFPTAPPPYEIQGVGESDLIDFTPELHKEALEIVKHYKMGPIFTPPVVSKAEGPWATLVSSLSGSNWMGGSIDPETGIVYVGSSHGIIGMGLVPSGTRSDVGYISGRAPGAQGALTVEGLPLVKPPYSQITAIDLKTGTILWHVPHGDTPDNVRNHPALKGLTIPRTGRGGAAITLVTKTLVIAGEKGVVTLADGRKGAMLRAYDKATGQDAGAVYMPAPATGGPMTYMVNGAQYIVIAVGGNINGRPQAQFMAFRLPSGGARKQASPE